MTSPTITRRDAHGRLRLSTFKPYGKRNRLTLAAVRAEDAKQQKPEEPAR